MQNVENTDPHKESFAFDPHVIEGTRDMSKFEKHTCRVQTVTVTDSKHADFSCRGLYRRIALAFSLAAHKCCTHILSMSSLIDKPNKS
jgi:hypothetical protein